MTEWYKQTWLPCQVMLSQPVEAVRDALCLPCAYQNVEDDGKTGFWDLSFGTECLLAFICWETCWLHGNIYHKLLSDVPNDEKTLTVKVCAFCCTSCALTASRKTAAKNANLLDNVNEKDAKEVVVTTQPLTF